MKIENHAATDASSPLETLRRAAPWQRFTGILLLIGSGVTLVAGIGMCCLGLVATAMFGEEGEREIGPALFLLGMLCIPLALVYIYPGILLMRCARLIGGADDKLRERALAESLETQRRLWKYVGLCLAALLALGVLGIGLVLLGHLVDLTR